MEEAFYTHDLFNTSLAIDYEQQGDRWIDYLREALAEKIVGVSGHGVGGSNATAEFHYPHWNFNINLDPNQNQSVQPQLRIVPTGDETSKGVYLFLTAPMPISEKDINAWTECINKAHARLDEANPEFEWAAALYQTTQGNGYALKRSTDIGSLRVRSGRKKHVSQQIGSAPQMGGMSINVSWPMILEGKATGYNWMTASKQAGQDSHMAAALISLAWGRTIRLLQAAQQVPPGQFKINSTGVGIDPQLGRNIKMPKSYKVLPNWVNDAFGRLERSPILLNALNAYYQGLTMEEDGHPSFALVAFTACIECVGRTTVGEKCACCGKEIGSKQRFKAGLSSVIEDKQEVKRISELYGARSETAHEGILHGSETMLGGVNFPSLFNPNKTDFFVWTDLRKIKSTARLCLIKAIKQLS